MEQKIERLTEYGKRNSSPDMGRIQEMHDLACGLGAKCSMEHVPGVAKQIMGESLPKIDKDKARRVLRALEAKAEQRDKVQQAAHGEQLPGAKEQTQRDNKGADEIARTQQSHNDIDQHSRGARRLGIKEDLITGMFDYMSQQTRQQ